MRVGLTAGRQSREGEDWLRIRWSLPETVSLRLCFGIGHATREVLSGLFRRLPHKTNCYFQEDFGPAWEESSVFCAQESLKAVRFRLSEPPALDEAAGRSLLMIGVNDDDPMTGEIYDWSNLESQCASQKVAFARVSSASFLRERAPLSVGAYSIRILQISPQISALVTGEKIKIEPLISESPTVEPALLKNSIEGFVENRQRVENFEAGVNFGRALLSGRSRLYDRAVLSYLDVDSSALMDLLCKRLGFVQNDETETFQRLIASGSSCQVGSTFFGGFASALKARGFTSEEIRGLLILDLSLLNETTHEELLKCHQDLLRMQGQVSDTPI